MNADGRIAIHDLTFGHLDPAAIRDRQAVTVKPLDRAVVARVLASFPGLTVEERDGYLIAERHGREDAERGRSLRRPPAARARADAEEVGGEEGRPLTDAIDRLAGHEEIGEENEQGGDGREFGT